ncbi:hypothetical protein FD39_GL000225 [Lactobacillus amylolyticus DSM 11664]|nr:hypothetical protein FD39_GL000225 [Lactobacillus amylolyticus DSM 11664]
MEINSNLFFFLLNLSYLTNAVRITNTTATMATAKPAKPNKIFILIIFSYVF